LARHVIAADAGQPPALLATQVPETAPASKTAVTQMSPVGHWSSAEHPPQ
jgi:hypothetical protein